jgi:predicted DNA-binding protein (UPF0251 family)/Zn-finger nucleic acid-binding protein
MSPRLKKIRKVLSPPTIKGFKPYGVDTKKIGVHEPIMLLFEEYEAFRLCDYDMYNHHQASVIMGVSRPTFTRIYASVRQKVAMAFVQGRQITIEGGKVYFDSDWYQCKKCNCYFNNPHKEVEIDDCPLCGSNIITSYNIGKSTLTEEVTCERQDICICPRCGFEIEHHLGKPCSHEICPDCNTNMMRKGESNKRRNINKP